MRRTSNRPTTPVAPIAGWAYVEAIRVIVIATTAWICLPVASAPGFRIIATPTGTICRARTWWGGYPGLGGTPTPRGTTPDDPTTLAPRRIVSRKHSALGCSHPAGALVVTLTRVAKRQHCCKFR